MSTIKSSDDHLTLNADGSSKNILFQADGVQKASISSAGLFTSTTIDATALTGNLPAIDGSSLTGIAGVGKNLIINGAMQVAQRGTSSTFTQSDKGYKTVDRFKVWEQGTPTAVFDLTQETDAPSEFKHSTKLACTTANTSGIPASVHMYVQYSPEASDLHRLSWGTSDAKATTLSFWAKSNLAGTYVVSFNAVGNDSGVDDSACNFYTAPYTLDGSGDWQYITLAIPANTLSNIKLAADNSVGMEIKWVIQSGTNYSSGSALTGWTNSPDQNQKEAGQTADLGATVGKYWQITGVKLEVGTAATDYDHRSYGEELRACQRYYEMAYETIAAGSSSGSNSCPVFFMVEKRAAPTIGYSALYSTVNAVSISGCYITRGNNQGAATIGGMTADAEL